MRRYTLDSTPADIVRYLLSDLEIGALHDSNDQWPVFVGSEPENPDDVLTVFDTQGTTQGRFHVDGEVQEQHGIMIRVRSTTYPSGRDKASEICKMLSANDYRAVVEVDEGIFRVHCLNQRGTINYLGREQSASERFLFTINYLATITQED